MGDRTYTPIGNYQRDIFSDNQEMLDDYTAQHQRIIKQLPFVTGINRTLALAFFNESYAFDRDVRIPIGSTMMYAVPKHTAAVYPEYAYLRRALDLCLKTDICQKLGFSLEDFMNIDLATFEFIEMSYYKHKPVEQDAIDGLLRDADLSKTAKGR